MGALHHASVQNHTVVVYYPTIDDDMTVEMTNATSGEVFNYTGSTALAL